MYKNIKHYIIVNRLQLIKFVVVGISTFCINMFCFYLFYSWLSLDYRLAVTLAYVITVISHFSLHRTFTFKIAHWRVFRQSFKYLSMLLLNYMITLIMVWFIVNVVQSTPYVGLIFSTGVTAGVNFIIMKYFVFDTPEVA